MDIHSNKRVDPEIDVAMGRWYVAAPLVALELTEFADGSQDFTFHALSFFAAVPNGPSW